MVCVESFDSLDQRMRSTTRHHVPVQIATIGTLDDTVYGTQPSVLTRSFNQTRVHELSRWKESLSFRSLKAIRMSRNHGSGDPS